MSKTPKKLCETASQTAGPYVHIGLAPGAAGFEIYRSEMGWDVAGTHTPGQRISVTGSVFDGTGTLVKDALIEFWQADSTGEYPKPTDPEAKNTDPDFRGWGRAITDFNSGEWRFETLMPGNVSHIANTPMAPHINLWIVARGINVGLNTRLYFEDESEANDVDPVLNLIKPAARKSTLIATRCKGAGKPTYHFDIHLQGADETVFFYI